MSAFSRADVVVVSSIDWDAAWQRHQIFAAHFAEAGHQVFFIENSGFRNPGWADLPRLWRKLVRIASPAVESVHNAIPQGLTVVPPRLLPPTFPLFRRLNEKVFIPQLLGVLRALGLKESPIVIVYSPTATTVALAERLNPGVLVYDCASNFRGHCAAPKDLASTEARLLELTDEVVCDSDFLFAQKQAEHARVTQIHQGVPEEFFAARSANGSLKTACYYGTWGQDLEPEFLAAAVRAGLEVTVSGFTKGNAPPLPPGVKRLPPAPREELVRRLEHFDAFLLPYRINPFLMGVVPAKIYECLATGRPVIATPLPSLVPLEGLVYLGKTPEDWERIVRDLHRTETPERKRARIELARKHTYAAEFARFYAVAKRSWGKRAPVPEAPQPWWTRARIQAFIEGFGWIGLLYGLARASTLLTQVVAGRLFGPLEYGRAHLAIAAAAFLQIIPILGFPTALGKFPSEEPSERRRQALITTALAAFLIWGAFSFVVFWASRGAMVRQLHLPPDILEASLSLAFCTAFYTVVSSPLLGLKRFAERGLSEALYGLAAPMILGLLYLRGGVHYQTLIAALCLGLLAASLFSIWSLRGVLRPRLDWDALPPIFGYTVVGGLNLLTMAFIISPGRLLLHKYFSADTVGVFSAYFTATAQAALAVLYMASSVVIPLASTPEGQRQALSALKRGWWAVLAAAFAFFLAAAAAALLIFGSRFPFHAEWMALFAAAAGLILLHGMLGAVFAARDLGGLGVSAAGNLAAGLAHVGLAFLLIPRWGVPGAAAALIGGYTLGLAVYAAVARNAREPL